jgi:Na+-transporting methylmalonyl-CoA/oxaloacetate decarboxylase beta subunit
MTVKQRAILQTAGIVAGILVSSIGVTLILEQLTRDQILFTLGAGSIALLIYSMYGVVLSRLEYEETLNKLNNLKG